VHAPDTVPPLYRPRRPWTTALYQVVDRHFETFAAVYDDRFASLYGPWRPVVRTTADAYLDCGRCDACGTERLLAFSCRRRGLCPSCAARTAALTAARLVETVLLPVPHRQVVLTIPKRLRIYFRVDRRLLGELARAAARAITAVVRVSTGEDRGAPGIILALQTFGQDLTFHPHVHALATEGLVRPDDTFVPVPTIDAPLLEHAFRRRVFTLLLRHQKITPTIVDAMHSWHHSGFSAHTAVRVEPAESQSAERVLRYLLRPPVANARTHTRAASQVEIVRTHPAPDGALLLTLDPLEFLARATSHIPRHPLCGREFVLVDERRNRHGDRVWYESDEGSIHTVPRGWTSLAVPDAFEVISAGRARFRPADLVHLVALLDDLREQGTDSETPNEPQGVFCPKCQVYYVLSRTGLMSHRLRISHNTP
jgi:hypothetical protein